MPDDATAANTLRLEGRARSVSPGDVPDLVKRRYYVDRKGGVGLGFYVDATVTTAAFRDRGQRLTAGRADPNAIRDMAAIAHHRGWSRITVQGDLVFRREAWLAAASLGLDVQGYRPTERDLQALDRRQARAGGRQSREQPSRDRSPGYANPAGRDQMRIVEAVVKARVDDPTSQARILDAARARIAGWLERGAWFPTQEPRRAPERSR